MKISRDQVNRAFNSVLPPVAERVSAKSLAESSAATGQRVGDSVQLSTDTGEFKRAVEAVKRAPDVRKDRVNELRKAIAEGTYKIDPMAVAEKMVGRMMVDRLLGSGRGPGMKK